MKSKGNHVHNLHALLAYDALINIMFDRHAIPAQNKYILSLGALRNGLSNLQWFQCKAQNVFLIDLCHNNITWQF